MKGIIGLSTAFGLFFGIVAYLILANIDGIVLAGSFAIAAGLIFATLLAASIAVRISSLRRKYTAYRNQNIAEPVLFEDIFSKLNGDRDNTGRLFLTKDRLLAVMLKGKKVLAQANIPLSSIVRIAKDHRYGHLPAALITQADGTETAFVSDYEKLRQSMLPLVGQGVFDNEAAPE